MSNDDSEAPAGEPAPEAGPVGSAQPRIAMLFSATTWTFNVRLGRSGREEGEGVIVMGELSYRSASGERVVYPARAMVVRSDPRKRLDLVISPKECVLTIPLEPFAMQRLQDRLKEMISRYGMSLRIAFAGSETEDRQNIEAVDFAFSSGPRHQGARAAQSNDR
jgi:hypothetical protein